MSPRLPRLGPSGPLIHSPKPSFVAARRPGVYRDRAFQPRPLGVIGYTRRGAGAKTAQTEGAAQTMGRVLKYLFYLVLLAALALAIYAALADLPPPSTPMEAVAPDATGG
jgi:hypothetical protein